MHCVSTILNLSGNQIFQNVGSQPLITGFAAGGGVLFFKWFFVRGWEGKGGGEGLKVVT